MLNLIIALVAGIAVAGAIIASGFQVMAGVIPGVIVFIGAFIGLGIRIVKQVQAVMTTVQTELSSISGPKEAKVKSDKAIKLLEGALPLGRWQFLVEGEIQAQIGAIKFLFEDNEGAMTAFAKASARNYMTRAYAAAIYFQKAKYDDMERSFEDAVKNGKKDGMVWAAYAWCLLEQKKKDKALSVMARAVEANPSDDKLKGALTALQNDKRLKMKAWEPMWWQFRLEKPPMQQPQFMASGRRPRFMRR